MKSNLKNNKFKIAVIGGGYVGLPLAIELATKSSKSNLEFVVKSVLSI